MGKRRKQRKWRTLSLPNPHPSPPSHPGDYVLYCDRDEKDIIWIYSECYAAHIFITHILNDEEYEYVDDDKDLLVTEGGTTIRCSKLEEIMDYELSREEEVWDIEPYLHKHIQHLLYGEKEDEYIPPEQKRAPKLPKHKRKDYIGIKTIAAKLGQTPQQTRGLLRKFLEKPEIGWLFLPTELDEVVGILREEA